MQIMNTLKESLKLCSIAWHDTADENCMEDCLECETQI